MGARLASWLARPGLVRSVLARLRLAVRLLRDRRVPWAAKALALLPLVYVVIPIDVLPDLIPLLGQLDDIGVLVLFVEGFVRLAPADVVTHHLAAIEAGQPYTPSRPAGEPAGRVIDAEWRRE